MLFEAINFKKHVPSRFLTKTTALFVNLAQVDKKKSLLFPSRLQVRLIFIFLCSISSRVRLTRTFFFPHPAGTWSAHRLLQAFLFFPTYLLHVPSRMDKRELFGAVIWSCSWLEAANRVGFGLRPGLASVQHPDALYSIY